MSDVGQAVGALAPIVDATCALASSGWRRDRVGAANARRDLGRGLAVVALTAVVNVALKLAVRRPRPPAMAAMAGGHGHDLSFPSGHAAVAAAGSVCWAQAASRRWPAGRGRRRAAAAVVAGATAWGRVAGGLHFVGDAVAGLAVGALVAAVVPYAVAGRRRPGR